MGPKRAQELKEGGINCLEGDLNDCGTTAGEMTHRLCLKSHAQHVRMPLQRRMGNIAWRGNMACPLLFCDALRGGVVLDTAADLLMRRSGFSNSTRQKLPRPLNYS